MPISSKPLGAAQIAPFFREYEKSAFLLTSADGRRVISVWNPQNCHVRVSPCSTFKIANSLIALETGAVSGADEKFTWDGVRRAIPEWNRDQTLATAFRYSVVPVYQEIARKIGPQKMQAYLDKIGYGNRVIAGGIDQFWLNNSLRISPREQIDLLARLVGDVLPFSPQNQHTVRQMMRLDQTPIGTLYGKTGGTNDPAPLGWFVGYVVSGKTGETLLFAANVADGNASGKEAKGIVTNVLRFGALL